MRENRKSDSACILVHYSFKLRPALLGEVDMTTNTPTKPKPAKLGAEKLTPEEQRRRFEALAREAGCDESSEARFEAAVTTIARHRPRADPPAD